MSQTFGHFIPPPTQQDEYLHIGFSPSSIPLKQRWRNNGLSADFLANYLSAFYAVDEHETAALQQHQELRATVSHVANELMENAMKYYDEASALPIHIQLHLQVDYVRIYVTNSLTLEQQAKFQVVIQQLLDSDPQELYLQLIEAASLDDTHATSGLGLLGLLDDYQAILGWQFCPVETAPERIVLVTTMAQLNL